MPKNQKTAPFDAQAFFEAMGPGQTASKHQPQDVIFCQGDRADSVFYVQSGKVKLSVTSTNGKEAVIAVLGDGDFFGEGKSHLSARSARNRHCAGGMHAQ